MTPLEQALGHRFVHRELLEAALVHSSYASERPELVDNERLEFLGDAVLQLAVTEHLYVEYPDLAEGQLAKVRAGVVNREVLAAVARRIGLGPRLQLGLGEEQSGGRAKDSILADAMEAVIAAVYLDAGHAVAARVVTGLWEASIRERAEDPGRRDFKTRYQEVLAAVGKRPVYEVTGEGPDHERVFAAVVSVDGRVTGRGTGRSKKEAEQAAARAAIQGG
jgi:ribonuclease III